MTESQAQELNDCISQVWKYARKHGDSLDLEVHCKRIRAVVAVHLEAKDARIEQLGETIGDLRRELAEKKREIVKLTKKRK